MGLHKETEVLGFQESILGYWWGRVRRNEVMLIAQEPRHSASTMLDPHAQIPRRVVGKNKARTSAE